MMDSRNQWAYLLALMTIGPPAHATLNSTSSDGYGGNVGQAFSKVRVTVGAQWLDIEEDAELSAQPLCDGCGTGPWLVEGTFNVPSNTVITGCLLWNDDTLLMGKLRGKATAVHMFDSLVPVHPVGYRYDPLLVEQVGDSTYHLKLYPIADGGVRRIRLRYLVPVTSVSGETSILPVLTQALSGSAPSGWTLDVRGNAPNLRIFHDSSWFPIAPGAERALDFATCGAVRLSWTTLVSGGARAVRSRVDTGAWAGDYVLFTGKVPDSIGRRIDIKSETVFLWRWVSPQSFFIVDGLGNRSIDSFGLAAIAQSRRIVELSGQLAGAGNKVGLVADQGMNDTTVVFPLSDSTGPDYRRMKSWLNGVDVDYLLWRIPAPASFTPEQGSLDIATNRQRFSVDVQAAGTLYSQDSGIVRHLVVITVGPVPSGGDLQIEPNLSALPTSVSVASSQLLSGWGCVYDPYGYCSNGTLPPSTSKWPGIDLDGAAAARPGTGTLASLEGVLLPKIRRVVAATMTLTSSQGKVSSDVRIQRGPDGSWLASINAQAKGIGQQVSWNFFNDSATVVVASWTQTPAWTVANGDSAVPRLWAASRGWISPNFSNSTSLAPIFGIIDRQYSLLATPSDSMGRKRQVAYVDSGVPFLSTKDIFWKVGYGESSPTILGASLKAKGGLSVSLLAGLRRVRIDFTGLDARSIEVRDIRGHKIAAWDREALAGRTSVVWNGRNPSGGRVPSGLYVVVVRMNTRTLTESVALP